MKYRRTWTSLHSQLPRDLQSSCIDYKKWKKAIKRLQQEQEQQSDGSRDLLRLLEAECAEVSRVFVGSAKRRRRTTKAGDDQPLLQKCLPRCLPRCLDPESVRMYAELNRTCLYKICKKLDKKASPAPRALEWMARAGRELRFAFMGGKELTSLRMSLPTECPVCLEERDEVAISRCGHVVCIACLEIMYDMRGRKGTFHNLIDARDGSRSTTCPLCRKARPFSSVLFWPEAVADQYRIQH